MKCAVFRFAPVAGLFAAILPGTAFAGVAQELRKTVVTVDVPVALPMSEPLKDRFGLGTMPSLSAALPVGSWFLAGLRLRGGFLSDGPAPSDPSIQDPGKGGLAALSAVVRLRPLAKRDAGARAPGPWMDLGAGPGLTGHLVRAVAEAGLGWNFRMLGLTVGPSARYLRVFQPANQLDSADAQILLFGIELALRDPGAPGAAAAPTEQAPATTVEVVKLADRDGDGIPDNLDKCPDDPEDKDGFEDDDGCPDLDNDKDGIPDASDACPNEPETVNGFQDEDGCPDSAPIVVKENRIMLTEHLLFDTNRARVNADARPALAAVFNLWKQHPEWDYLVVDGYADRRGPDGYNYWLSHQRAERVVRVLVEMGFPPEKLRIRAFGNRQVRVDGDDEEAYRQNRRVEFVIVKKGETPAPDIQAAQPPPPAQGGALEP
jgi:outer membrane protein OmpA-like peptidoglycan-associated protein